MTLKELEEYQDRLVKVRDELARLTRVDNAEYSTHLYDAHKAIIKLISIYDGKIGAARREAR